jgi:hypothetical protein
MDKMSDAELAKVLESELNVFGRGYSGGQRVGRILQNTHRTLQGEIIRWCLGVITGISDVEIRFTDARNEAPVIMGKKLAKMLEDGEIDMGYMI